MFAILCEYQHFQSGQHCVSILRGRWKDASSAERAADSCYRFVRRRKDGDMVDESTAVVIDEQLLGGKL